MEDVLHVYHQAYDPEYPVVCVDEQPKQLVKETRIPIPAGKGRPERVDYEYERNGMANIFMAVEPLRGVRTTSVTKTRTRKDFAYFLESVIKEYPDAKVILIVLDNLNTHTIGSFYETFPPDKARELAERVEFHYTPKHGSWLNIAELEFSALSRQCLDRRIGEIDTMTSEVAAWQHQRNAEEVTINWQFRTPDARIKLRRLYPQTQAT